MDLGFEAAKGAAEKVTGIKLPVFMRILLPGLLATAVLYPAVGWVLGYLPSDADHWWQRLAGYAVLVYVSGALISNGNGEIYKAYEGRTRWPRGLREWAIGQQQKRVDRLLKASEASEASESSEDQTVYDETWYELRDYPTDDNGRPRARYPTMIGNILAGYEQYPNERYGMDSVFYWPRIWLQLDKEKKEEIESQWCVADGFLTLSAISMAGGLIWALQALPAVFGLGTGWLPTGSVGYALAAVPGWVVLGYSWYRMSLPFHRENGEIFKSIFDVYRDKVWDLTSLKPHEKKMWTAAWAYLQYLMVKCPNCGEFTVTGEKCEKCGFGLMEANRGLEETGRFP